ncbi:MAG: hypothetical protein ABH863_03695, partial [Candidatus Micrarchaeota archaeon]
MAELVEVEELKQETRQKNLEVRKLAEENQSNIARLRELLDEADAHKKQRDEFNSKVRETSDKRKALIEEARKIDVELKTIELEAAKYKVDGGIPLGRLERMVEQMEWRLQTQSMPVKDENALSQEIRKLLKEKQELEKAQPLRRKAYDLRRRRQELNMEFRALDEAYEMNAKESDKHHEAMLKAYKRADDARGKISDYLEKLGEKRKDADESYSKLQEVRGEHFAQEEYGRMQDKREKKKKEMEKMGELEERAKLIYDNFKAGKKVTMDEL